MKKYCAFLLPVFSLFVGMNAIAEPTFSIVASANRHDLPLDGTGTATSHIVKVAALTLSTAAPNGYTLLITSGTISKNDGQPIPYQVTAVPTGVTPTSGDFTVALGDHYRICSTVSKDLDVYIRYTPASLQDPGIYSSTISLVAEDNTTACP